MTPDAVRNTKVIGLRQIGTVGTSLIPTLYSSTIGAKDDGEVKRAWLAPFVEDFVADQYERGRILFADFAILGHCGIECLLLLLDLNFLVDGLDDVLM